MTSVASGVSKHPFLVHCWHRGNDWRILVIVMAKQGRAYPEVVGEGFDP